MNFAPSGPAYLKILRRGLVYRLLASEARRIVDAQDLQPLSAGVYLSVEGGLPLVAVEPSVIHAAAEAGTDELQPRGVRVVMLAGAGDIGLGVVADEVSIDNPHEQTHQAIPISIAHFAEFNPAHQKV